MHYESSGLRRLIMLQGAWQSKHLAVMAGYLHVEKHTSVQEAFWPRPLLSMRGCCRLASRKTTAGVTLGFLVVLLEKLFSCESFSLLQTGVCLEVHISV